MKQNIGFWLALASSIAAVDACKSASNPDEVGAAGGAGRPAAGRAGSSASAGKGAANSSGGSGGSTAGAGTEAGGAAGSSEGGEAGQTGGRTNAGTGGSAHAGSGGRTGPGGGAGEAGEAGSGANALGPELRDEIPGPTTVDQMPIIISHDHLVIDGDTVHKAFRTSDGKLVILTGLRSVAKYTVEGEQVWSHTQVEVTGQSQAAINDIALTDDDEILYGGVTDAALPGETQVDASGDAYAGKLDSEGQLVWQHQWGSSAVDQTEYVAAGPDGSLLALGVSAGQVPGNSSANAGKPFAERYSADGTRLWLKQAVGGVPFLAAPDGTMYLSGSDLLTLDVDGNVGTETALTIPNGHLPLPTPGELNCWAFAPNGHSFYLFWGAAVGQEPMVSEFDPNGVLWYRNGATRSEVVDSVENVIWNGHFNPIGHTTYAFTVDADSVYISGFYLNSYQNGSVPRPSVLAGYVARLSLTGEELWFQEYLIDDGSTDPGPQAPHDINAVSTDSDGNVVVFADYYQTTSYFFTLKKSDGSLLR